MLENIEQHKHDTHSSDFSYKIKFKKSYMKFLNEQMSRCLKDEEPMLDIVNAHKNGYNILINWHSNKTEEVRYRVVIEMNQNESQQTSIGGN